MSASRLAARAMLAAAAATALVVGVSACTSPSSTSSHTAGAASRGGTFTTQFTGVPISLNPALGGSGGSAIYTGLDYDSLIYQTGDGKLIPDLATKWSFNSDNTKLTLTLRKGVTFTDGTTLDANAVKASLEYFLKAGGGDVSYAGPVTSIDTPSSDTVVISYSSSYPDATYYLSQYWSVGQIIGPKGLADPKSLLTSSDGTGQYTYSKSESVTNSSYTYVRNKNYFNPSAQQFDKVVVKVIGDPSATLSAATTGQVEFASASSTTAPNAKSSGLNILSAPFFTWGITVADYKGTIAPALANSDVRQAMALAVDRKALANALGAQYTQANGQLGAKGIDGYINGYGFQRNLSKAKSLMARAGYPNGFSLNILTENVLDSQTTISQALASDLGKIGIKVKLVVKNTVPDFIQASLTKQYPAVIWPVVGATSAQVLSNFIHPGVTDPFGNADPTLTQLYQQAMAAPTAADRTADYRKITKASNKAAWFAPAVTTDNVYMFSSKLTNVTASALNPNPLPEAPDEAYAWKLSK